MGNFAIECGLPFCQTTASQTFGSLVGRSLAATGGLLLISLGAFAFSNITGINALGTAGSIAFLASGGLLLLPSICLKTVIRNRKEDQNLEPEKETSPGSEMILPVELLIYTATFLNPRAVAQCSLVSKDWHAIFSDNTLWKTLYFRDFGSSSSEVQSWKLHYFQSADFDIAYFARTQAISCMKTLPSKQDKIWVIEDTISLYDSTGLSTFSLDGQWKFGAGFFNNAFFMCYHDDRIEKFLYPLYDCGAIKISAYNGQKPSSGNTAGKPIDATCVYENLLFCASGPYIDIFNLDNFCSLSRSFTVERAITSLCVWDGLLMAGSANGLIYKWRLCDYTYIGTDHVRLSDREEIQCMQLTKNAAVCGRKDGKIEIVSLSDKYTLQVLKGHRKRIIYLAVSRKKIFSLSEERKLRIWGKGPLPAVADAWIHP